MHAARRFVIALVLLATMPLRAMAGATMPCCPVDGSRGAEPMAHRMAPPGADATAAADATTSSMSMSMSMPDHDGVTHPVVAADCCAAAMIAAVVVLPLFLPYVPPREPDARVDAVAAFLTDAPERPPRLTILAA